MFTSTSAVCVTGLVVLDVGNDLSIFGQIVLILLIQTGGLGFMTIATLLFMVAGKRITLRDRLVIQEAMNESGLSGMVRLIRLGNLDDAGFRSRGRRAAGHQLLCRISVGLAACITRCSTPSLRSATRALICWGITLASRRINSIQW